MYNGNLTSQKFFGIINKMKEKQLKKLAKQIMTLENNIAKAYQVEDSRNQIEKIMSSLSLEDAFQLDDYIFTHYQSKKTF